MTQDQTDRAPELNAALEEIRVDIMRGIEQIPGNLDHPWLDVLESAQSQLSSLTEERNALKNDLNFRIETERRAIEKVLALTEELQRLRADANPDIVAALIDHAVELRTSALTEELTQVRAERDELKKRTGEVVTEEQLHERLNNG